MPHNGADYEIFKHNIENSPKRSEFNLSYKNIFNCEMGLLRPFYIEETLPSDKFTISNAIMARISPMEVPLMSRIRIFTDYYYMKNEWIWNNWREFITKGRNGDYEVSKPKKNFQTSTDESIQEYTKQGQEYKVNNGALSKDSLAAALEFPILMTNQTDGTEAPGTTKPTDKRNYSIDIDTMPFFMYQKIYRDYYMNKNINQNDKTWFPDIEDNFILGGGTSNPSEFLPDTADNDKYISEENNIWKADHNLFAWRWVNWRDDYFTSAMPWQQRGTPPNLQANLSEIEARTTVTSQIQQNGTVLANDNLGNSLSASNGTIGRNTIEGWTNYTGDIKLQTRLNNISINNNATTTIENTASLAITAENLRRLLAVQIWQERNARTDGDYNQMIKAHFGFNPNSQERRPIYIGGTVQEVVITELLQTSESGTTPQGNATGHAISNGNGFVGTFTAPDFGWIMGIMYIVPDPVYCDGIHRRYTRETALDYYWDEFNGLGAQEILRKELIVGEEESNETVWAWQERFSEYKHRRNITTGELADSDDIYFNAWTIKREVPTNTEFNQEFVTTEKNIAMDSFTIENETPFTIEVANIVKANRPIPYLSAPNNMGVN